MSIIKKLGVWMDHASAHLIEFSMDSSESTTMSSKFTHEQKKNRWVKMKISCITRNSMSSMNSIKVWQRH